MIKLPVFKKKRNALIYATNMSVKVLRILFLSSNEGKNKAGIKFSSLAIPGYCFNIFG